MIKILPLIFFLGCMEPSLYAPRPGDFDWSLKADWLEVSIDSMIVEVRGYVAYRGRDSAWAILLFQTKLFDQAGLTETIRIPADQELWSPRDTLLLQSFGSRRYGQGAELLPIHTMQVRVN